MTAELLRPHAEQVHAGELDALAKADDKPKPPSWRLSPQAVVTYLLGGVLADGTLITPKYVGPRRLIEVAVATLATDRALLLLGVPGTAKTWVSEHLAAAIWGAFCAGQMLRPPGEDPSRTDLDASNTVIVSAKVDAIALGAQSGQDAIFVLIPADQRAGGCAERRVVAAGRSIEMKGSACA